MLWSDWPCQTRRLVAERRASHASGLANRLLYQDIVDLGELGDLPFAQGGAALTLHLNSKLDEHVSLIMTSHRVFWKWSSVLGDVKIPSPFLLGSPTGATSRPAMPVTASRNAPSLSSALLSACGGQSASQ
jgi:hypothetical protein